MSQSQSYHPYINIKDYLADELERDIKHELIAGQLVMMAGASVNHERISVNILTEFRNHLKNSDCEPFGSDMKLRIGSNFFYPDAMVDCDFDEAQPYYTNSPCIIVEVLSKSTRRIDKTSKRLAYMNLASLQEYVLIEQDFVDIEVMRKSEGWVSEHYYLGDSVTFNAIGLNLAVADIYQRVNNEDMLAFINSPA